MRSTASVLPRSGHASLRDEVAATKRGRLLVGLCDVVADKGYAAATVADVLKASGLSRRTFYEHFADKQACFLAAYDHGAGAMQEAIAAAVAPARGWREATEAAVTTYLELLTAEPGFARAFLVEIWVAGPDALRRHRTVIARFEQLVAALHERAIAEQDGRARLAPLSAVQIAAVTGGISRVATTAILEGRSAALPAQAGELVEFVAAVIARPA
ncbi:hypothetical protein DSM104299_01508 [Baekduia alba]|uniref:TetR/AcrR family transcriptional regulator n=1 Tax=Baekduia alba TaxID=2997333 RepID=UPI0023426508|nr:TetR/AcrR family transcriptional regulator [Baekduia alba]WCB92808.1 hypothetical protein DSM104299_01508 [Baekduia alba]